MAIEAQPHPPRLQQKAVLHRQQKAGQLHQETWRLHLQKKWQLARIVVTFNRIKSTDVKNVDTFFHLVSPAKRWIMKWC